MRSKTLITPLEGKDLSYTELGTPEPGTPQVPSQPSLGIRMARTLASEASTSVHIKNKACNMGKIGVQTGPTFGTTNKSQNSNLYARDAIR